MFEIIGRIYFICLLIIVSLNQIMALEMQGPLNEPILNEGSVQQEETLDTPSKTSEILIDDKIEDPLVGTSVIQQDDSWLESVSAKESKLLSHVGASALIIVGVVQSVGALSSYNELVKKNNGLNDQAKIAANLAEYRAYRSQIKDNKEKMAGYESSINTYKGLVVIGLLWEGWILKLYDNTDKNVSLPYVPDLKITQNINDYKHNMSMNLHWKF